MSDIAIRHATPDDAAGINAVYNPFIRTSAATFETVEHSEAQRRAWLLAQAANPRWPVIAAICDGAVCGFAGAAAFDPRGAYETSVKVSVFIDPSAQGRGLGRRLYSALFTALDGQGVHRAYALIVAPNPASVALHRAYGFDHVATLCEVGRKFGRFHDVMWFEKKLG